VYSYKTYKESGMKKVISIILVIMAASGFIIQSHAYEFGPVEIHGFASQGYLKTSDNNYLGQTKDGSFELTEAGVNFSSSLTDKIRLGLQLFSHDLGDQGNNKFMLDWAFIDYHWQDELGIRVGKVKAPFGFYNEGRDLDMLRTFILLPQSIYDECRRDSMNAVQGGGIYGSIAAGLLGSIDYQNMIGTMNIYTDNQVTQTQIAAFLPPILAASGPKVADNGVTCEYTNNSAIIWNTPIDGLRVGGTMEFAKFHVYGTLSQTVIPTLPSGTPFDSEMEIKYNYVLSAEYERNNLTVAGEYNQMKVEMDSGFPGVPTASNTMEGYYGRISYRFTDWFEAGSYYSVFYANKDDKNGKTLNLLTGFPDFMAWQKDACLALRFDINPHWLIKLEAHQIDGSAQTNAFFTTEAPEEDWQLFGVKTTFSF